MSLKRNAVQNGCFNKAINEDSNAIKETEFLFLIKLSNLSKYIKLRICIRFDKIVLLFPNF